MHWPSVAACAAMIAAHTPARGTVCLPGVLDVAMPTPRTLILLGSLVSRIVAIADPVFLMPFGVHLGPPEPSVYATCCAMRSSVKPGVDVAV